MSTGIQKGWAARLSHGAWFSLSHVEAEIPTVLRTLQAGACCSARSLRFASGGIPKSSYAQSGFYFRFRCACVWSRKCCSSAVLSRSDAGPVTLAPITPAA
jgi:hypothetical protein